MSDYEKLRSLFESYSSSEWQEIFSKIFNHESLNVPVSFQGDHPIEALVFVDNFLRKKDQATQKVYRSSLFDYYASLSINVENAEIFRSIHFVFSKIIAAEFVYSLEKRFMMESFLKLDSKGEYLQINLLSVLGTLSKREKSEIVEYLFNRHDQYSSSQFILVSLRYMMKSGSTPSYTRYLNALIKNKINQKNSGIFIQSFQELVSFEKSYSKLYHWYVESKRHHESKYDDKYVILDNSLTTWVNYKNPDIEKDSFCELLFFAIHKKRLIPAKTMANVVKILGKNPEIVDHAIRNYIEYTYDHFNEYKEYSHFDTPVHRVVRNKVFLDPGNCDNDSIKYFTKLYKIPKDDFLRATLNLYDFSKLRSYFLPKRARVKTQSTLYD